MTKLGRVPGTATFQQARWLISEMKNEDSPLSRFTLDQYGAYKRRPNGSIVSVPLTAIVGFVNKNYDVFKWDKHTKQEVPDIFRKRVVVRAMQIWGNVEQAQRDFNQEREPS